MARKKTPSAARNRREEIEPKPESRQLAEDLSPPPPGEFENLKSLNQLLLKETMERREQVSQLNSRVEDLSADHLILSSIERDVLSSLVSRSAAEKGKIQTDFDKVVSLKDGILLDIDSKTKEVEDLRTANSKIRSALERVEKERADDSEVMKAEREANAGRLLALEEKYQSVVVELSGSRDEINLLKKEEEMRVLKVLEELDRVRVEFGMLKAEKEEGETRFEGQMKESKKKLDEFKAMVAEITVLKDEIEQARAMQEVEIARLQNEAELKQCTVLELERVCKDHADTNARLLADIDSRRRDLDLKREEVEGLRSQVGNLEKSRDGFKEELESLHIDFSHLEKEKEEGEAQFEFQMKKTSQQLDDLRKKMGGIEAQRDEMERARADQEIKNAELQKEVDKLQCILSELERVHGAQAEANALLQADVEAARDDLDLEREESEGLRSQVGELEKSNDGLKEELERLLLDLALVKKEKEEGEKCLEDRLKEITQCLVDSKGEVVEISSQRDEIERARADQEAKNAELQKEVDKLQCNLSELERVHKAQADANALLQADVVAARGDLELEREEATDLRSQVGELEKSKDGLKEELERLLLDLALLKKEKEEGETRLEDRLKETTQRLLDSKREVMEISAQRDEIDRARDDQEYQKAELQRDVDQLRSTVSELESVCKAHVEEIILLQVDKDAAYRDLGLEKGVAEGLMVQVSELQRSNDKAVEELEKVRAQHQADIAEWQKVTSQLRSELEGVGRVRDVLRLQVADLEKANDAIIKNIQCLKAEDEEHKAQIRSLAEEKASLETRLAEAQHQLEGATRKIKNVEMNSERALSLLKSTVGFVLGSEREVVVRDLAENGDEMQPFASELEAIRTAFVSKTLQRKRKGGFWAWIYPAITTAALAAISLAYATKGAAAIPVGKQKSGAKADGKNRRALGDIANVVNLRAIEG